MKRRKSLIIATLALGLGFNAAAQEGRVNIQQDSILPQLLELKAEMTRSSRLGDRYRIQIFSGDNNAASEILKEFRNQFPEWPSTIVYDTPNYKVWIGNFRNSLEADRALRIIRSTFPAAFRLKPERI